VARDKDGRTNVGRRGSPPKKGKKGHTGKNPSQRTNLRASIAYSPKSLYFSQTERQGQQAQREGKEGF